MVNFSQQELSVAQGLIDRKSMGKRITFLGASEDSGIGQDRLKRAFEFLASQPATRRALSRSAGQVIRSQELGFGSVQEARQFRGFGRDKFARIGTMSKIPIKDRLPGQVQSYYLPIQSFDQPPGQDIFLRPESVVSGITEPTGEFDALARTEFRLTNLAGELRGEEIFEGKPSPSEVRNLIGDVGANFLIPFARGGLFAQSLLTRSPTETVPEIATGIVGIGSKVLSGEGFPMIGEFARTDPLGFTARIGGELFSLKGTSVALKGASRGTGLARAFTIDAPKLKLVETRNLPKFGTTESFIGGIDDIGELGLIAEGGGPKILQGLPTPPTIRGAFGFSAKEQASFIGAKGPVTTSAKGLFSQFKKELTVSGGDGGLGLFLTPPQEGRGFFRASRLFDKEGSILDLIRDTDLKLLPKQPQIVVFTEGKVGTDFKPFGFPGSELEVTLPPGKIIQQTGVPAVTLIKGRRVPIVTAKIVDDFKTPSVADIIGDIKSPIGDIKAPGTKGIGGGNILKDLGSSGQQTFFPARRTASSLIPRVGSGVSGAFSQLGGGFSPSELSKGISNISSGASLKGFSGPSPSGFGDFFRGLPRGGRSGLSPGSPSGGGGGGSGRLPRPDIGFPTLGGRRSADRKRKQKKGKKKRTGPRRLAPSFTASALGLRGPLPKEIVSGTTKLGISPGDLRKVPL